uniref:Uncharacterized protein n=1 Tax=Coccidioides posadasii RMSCC 3488 TaxID=454284 RepID=A0A0J6IHG3_COCPO|nr:hypothetical protein CPAG_07575 [Coccidioides posadasii RMSCC 3488]
MRGQMLIYSFEKASSSASPVQPKLIRLLYDSACVILTADLFIFYTGSRLLFPEQEEIRSSAALRFFLRCAANTSFPFALCSWLLRDYHIRHTHVGRVVGSCFALSHAASVALYSWSRWVGGEYQLANFWGIVGLHGTWAGIALWGLLSA